MAKKETKEKKQKKERERDLLFYEYSQAASALVRPGRVWLQRCEAGSGLMLLALGIVTTFLGV